MKKEVSESQEPKYAFFHLFEREVWSARKVEVRVGDGTKEPAPFSGSPLPRENLARILAPGEELSTKYTPVIMLRRRELGDLLRVIGENQIDPQYVAALTNSVFESYTGPESSIGELACYGLHLFPSLDAIYDLNIPVPVTNKAHADFVSYHEDVLLKDVGRTVNIVTTSHGKQPVFNVRLEHIADGELSRLFKKMGVRFPPSS